MTTHTLKAPSAYDPTLPGRVAVPGRWWRATRAEWTKLTSVRSTYVAALISIAVAAGLSFLFSLAVTSQETNPMPDAVGISAIGVTLGQFGLLALATLAITAEYAAGTVRPTLSAVPSRGVLIAAKAGVVAVFVFIGAFLMAALSTLAAVPLLGDDAKLTGGEWLESSARSALAVTLLAVFAVGLGLVLRSTAGTITGLFGLLFAPMIVTGVVGNEVVTTIVDHLPSALSDGVMSGNHDLGGVVSGLLLGAWALGSLVVGYLVLKRRDA